jgi:hypothetical protein
MGVSDAAKPALCARPDAAADIQGLGDGRLSVTMWSPGCDGWSSSVNVVAMQRLYRPAKARKKM